MREAHGRGARLILLGQLFATPYFCQDQLAAHFDLAGRFQSHPLLARFSALARELGVVLPVSFFERSGPAFYNSVVILDADGAMLGTYRKSHIPDEPGFSEKFYFSPGDSGFRAWDTAVGRIGVGIGWDQWFPETASAGKRAARAPPRASGAAPSSPDRRGRCWARPTPSPRQF